MGWKKEGDEHCSYSYHPTHDRDVKLHIPEDVTVLVGHNIKFDLLWLWDTEELQDFFRRGGTVWCTQLAEYLIRAQHHKFRMCALEDIAPMYGGTKKVDAVKDMWEAGYLTSQIPKDLLVDYLVGTEEEARNGGDIHNTELAYLGQLKAAKKMNMVHTIQQRMEALLATTMMEWNGLFIDVKEARTTLKKLKDEFHTLRSELDTFVPPIPKDAIHPRDKTPFEFQWTSDAHVSTLIFGGHIKYRKRVQKADESGNPVFRKLKFKEPLFNGEPVPPHNCLLLSYTGDESPCKTTADCMYWKGVLQDRFLSGKRKGDGKFRNVEYQGEPHTVWEECLMYLPPLVDRDTVKEIPIKGGWENKDTDAKGVPLMRVNSDAIKVLSKMDVPFCKAYSRYTALSKEIGTYYVSRGPKGDLSGMLTCVDPETKIIHHRLNHTITVTTRLTGSDPNMQNIPRAGASRVKAMFASRFGVDGVMIDADYSQMEVVGLGLLSGDANLIHDLRAGVDFHCKRVAIKHGIPYEEALKLCKDDTGPEYQKWHAERTKCKIFSFMTQYGAGAQTIANETGMTVTEVEELIALEHKTYPDVQKFIDSVIQSIESSARPFNDPSMGFRTFRRGYWQAPTGTLYSWRSYDAPAFMRRNGIMDTFSPPEIKNYPVQGTSGEIYQCQLGQVFRLFIRTRNYGGKAFLVNTVHDCVWGDAHKDVKDQVVHDLKRVLEDAPRSLKEIYGIESPVEFPVEVEVGPNMNDVGHYEIDMTKVNGEMNE